MNRRTSDEILKDLVAEICTYATLCDTEWDWRDEHNSDYGCIDDDQYDALVEDILEHRTKIRDLLFEATGGKVKDF